MIILRKSSHLNLAVLQSYREEPLPFRRVLHRIVKSVEVQCSTACLPGQRSLDNHLADRNNHLAFQSPRQLVGIAGITTHARLRFPDLP